MSTPLPLVDTDRIPLGKLPGSCAIVYEVLRERAEPVDLRGLEWDIESFYPEIQIGQVGVELALRGLVIAGLVTKAADGRYSVVRS